MINYWNPNFNFVGFMSSIWDLLGSGSFEANDMLNFFSDKIFLKDSCTYQFMHSLETSKALSP